MAQNHTRNAATSSDYRTMRGYLFVLAFGGAVLVMAGVQTAGLLVSQRLVADSYKVLQRQLSASYERDVAGVLEHQLAYLHMLLRNPAVIGAIRRGDREALMREIQWQYELKRQENPHVEVLHFHGPDNRTLLRVHQPENFGDDLTTLRPMIADANRTRESRTGFEIGKNGISYRAVVPITDGGDHLGALELGINIAYFTERLAEIFDVQVGVIFQGAAMQPFVAQHGDTELLPLGNDSFAFSAMDALVREAGRHSQQSRANLIPFDYQQKRYVAHKVFGINSYLGEKVGTLLVVADVSEQVEGIWRHTMWSSAGWLTLLMLLLFGQYRIFSRMQASIHKLAFYDQLTGLPNRSLLLDRLERAVLNSARNGEYLALLFIDLDNFKQLNDTRGHHVGDSLLQQVAERLRGCVRASDTVARQGGDEFVIVLEGLSHELEKALLQTHSIGEKIVAVLNEPYFLEDDLEHRCTSSIGVALSIGGKVDVDELLKRADISMYQAKAEGRNQVTFFQSTEAGIP
ncbi:diguanylate cyclase domain-containing protein [Thiohalomonas denitrificans]|nr:diguanylate cyclase [Thiohalomonas denitrificans]